MDDDRRLNPLRDEIRTEDVEQAIVYNAGGRVIFRKKGIKLSDEEYERLKASGKEPHRDSVTLSGEEWRAINAAGGMGLIHNHPFTHEGIFSDLDIKTLLMTPLIIVETVTADGTFILQKTKPSTPNLRHRVLGAYNRYWTIYNAFLENNAKNIKRWGDEGSIPKARVYAYLTALDRIISLGATQKAVQESNGALELIYIPLNDVIGKKIDNDFTVIELMDNILANKEIPKVKPGQTLRIEGPGQFPFNKERLMNKKLSDHVYSPKGESTERRKL